jgi:hypothetical protein
MEPAVKDRKKLMRQFYLCYDDLCKLQSTMPLAAVVAHQKRNKLSLSGDRLTYDEWVPVLRALSLDNSLHCISVHSTCSANTGNSVYALYTCSELVFLFPVFSKLFVALQCKATF